MGADKEKNGPEPVKDLNASSGRGIFRLKIEISLGQIKTKSANRLSDYCHLGITD